MLGFMENTGESEWWWTNASELGGMHLQELDNNGLENTLRPQWTWLGCVEMESDCRPHSRKQPHLPSPRSESRTTSQGNHLTHFHPISTAECVHFRPNGMSFCWSLWSRINPGIKTDFPGSNLPSSIDFLTLTEPVLPNLTWQPGAQWTASTLASHRELSSFSFFISQPPLSLPLPFPFPPPSLSPPPSPSFLPSLSLSLTPSSILISHISSPHNNYQTT